jgi:hypothetical protein
MDTIKRSHIKGVYITRLIVPVSFMLWVWMISDGFIKRIGRGRGGVGPEKGTTT